MPTFCKCEWSPITTSGNVIREEGRLAPCEADQGKALISCGKNEGYLILARGNEDLEFLIQSDDCFNPLQVRKNTST